MNHRNLALLLATVVFMSGCDQLQTTLQGDAADNSDASNMAVESTTAPGGKLLVTVNGTAITEDTLNIYTRTRKPQPGGSGVNSQEAIIGEIVSLELMRQEGDRNNLSSRPVVAALLDQQKRAAIAAAAISDFMQAHEASDEEAQMLYDEKMGNAGKEFNARHILLKTKEEAVEVIVSIDKGADFSEVAMEKSTGPSGKSGGKLGWFAPAQMVKPFSDATAALETGTYSKEPVETQFGWHVIILDDVRDITPPPFDDVKDRLKLLIANQQLQIHVQELKASANIQVNK